jgi:hypothetical protein
MLPTQSTVHRTPQILPRTKLQTCSAVTVGRVLPNHRTVLAPGTGTEPAGETARRRREIRAAVATSQRIPLRGVDRLEEWRVSGSL